MKNIFVTTIAIIMTCMLSNVEAKSRLISANRALAPTSTPKLVCPTTAKANHPLHITTVNIQNNDCNNPIYITNTVVGLFGNSGGTLGLQGPFVNPYSLTVAPATCTQVPYDPACGVDCGYYYDTQATTQAISNLLVVNKVPAHMVGTLIGVSAGVLDDKNQLKIIGTCNVTVTK